ncbi:unnamed protein product [Prunus brigantina]
MVWLREEIEILKDRTLKDIVLSKISKTDLPMLFERGYLARSKGFRFYYPNYGTQIVETGCANFIEYEENPTGNEDFTFEEEGVVAMIENAEPDPTTLIPMSDIALAPQNDQLEPPQFEELVD